MDMLNLEICTPEKIIFSGEVSELTLPALEGEMTILAGHAPFISPLKSGILSFKTASDMQKMAAHYGFVEINFEKTTVLVDIGEMVDEIDMDRAKRAESKARNKMGELQNQADDESRKMLEIQEAKLIRALVRQSLH